MIIYKITNQINGKAYIGQTSKTLRARWLQHCQLNRKRACPLIRDAIAKYGSENFDIEVLEVCESKRHLNEREHFWITNLKTTVPYGYNLTTGGYRVELSPLSRKKIAETLGGKPCSLIPFPKGNIPWNKGKPWPEEVRKRMSESHQRPEYKAHRGWKHGEQARLKMSMARKGVPRPDLLGRTFSDATKFKMSLRKRGMRLSQKTEFKGENAKVIRNIDTGEVFFSLLSAAEKYNCHPSGFSKCANGHIKTVKGYRWEFIHPKSQSGRKRRRPPKETRTSQMLFDFL